MNRFPKRKPKIDQMLQTPSTIENWKIVKLLGKGVSGEVWKASNKDQIVAIKLYKSEYSTEGTKELSLLQTLTHPCIVKGLQAGQWKGSAFLVMEYIDGRPLTKADPNILDTTTIKSIVRQLAEGIYYAHQQGVIHRDLKPENVLLTADNQIKILDFGVAAPINYDPTFRITEGSYLYMAPEQLAGKINFQNDLWGFGALLYQWLAGRHPYPAKTIEELSQQLLILDVEYPHHLNKQIPEEISYILHRCLRLDRKERYGNFQEILNDLDSDPVARMRIQLEGIDLDGIDKKIIRFTFLQIAKFFALVLIAIGTYYFAKAISGWLDLLIAFTALLFVLYSFYRIYVSRPNGIDSEEKVKALSFYLPRDKFARLIPKLGTMFNVNPFKYNLWAFYARRYQFFKLRLESQQQLSSDSSHIAALSMMAYYSYHKNNKANAIKYANRIIQVNPDNAIGLFFTKVLHAQSNQIETNDDQIEQTLIRN